MKTPQRTDVSEPPAAPEGTEGTPRPPKAFLSYCQTSPEYVERVVRLAEELASHGIELVFDQWDLREGQDLHSFMEQAVTDPTVTHVLIVCDPLYAEKADGRRGGVGTETLILSPAVYADVRQDRVVPVILQRDDEDRVRVPTYLSGRNYIDMSVAEREADGYEQLLRALYRRPVRTRPQLGSRPAFLEDHHEPLRTAGAARIARAAVTSHRPDMVGRWADYLDRLGDAIAAEEITDVPATDTELANQVFASIDRLRPYRDEFVQLLREAARYAGDRLDLIDRVHEFFERLVSIQLLHEQRRFREEAETENIGFITWELALYAVAVLIREQQFNALAQLLRPLHVRSRYGSEPLRSLGALEPPMLLHGVVNERNTTQRWREPAAERIRERTQASGVSFEQLMEADLLLWLRTMTNATTAGYWHAKTLRTMELIRGLTLFQRIRQPLEFARVAPALGVVDRAEYVRRINSIDADAFRGTGSGGRAFFEELLGLQSNERTAR